MEKDGAKILSQAIKGEIIMKTVVITGVSSGFGLEMANLFLANNWKVVGTVRDLERRKVELKDKLDLENPSMSLLELDVSKQESLDAFVSKIDNIDVLINNAGFGTYGALEDVTMEQIRYQMEVNFFGPTYLTKALLPKLRDRKGKIINISSLMGFYACPLSSIYSASKFALEGLSEGLMYELKSHGVDVATIQPGGHRTQFVSSISWGENSFNAGSPYQDQTNGFKNMMEKLSKRENPPQGIDVAKKALKLAQKDKMPRSVLVGSDAKLVSCLQSLLPAKLYESLMTVSNKKIFGS